jgi:hypothetical protein
VTLIAVSLFGDRLLSPAPSPTGSATPHPTASPTATEASPSRTPSPPPPSGEPTALTAFPGAAGYGSLSPGGRGGRVIYVTSLDDRGPGTLREALEAKGPRTVLFRVAGTIDLRNNIDITEPFVTIAGQSAPGDGVQLRGAMIRVMTSEVVIRYMRLRSGEPTRENPADVDGLTIHGLNGRVHDVVVDHSTMIWGPDIGGIAVLGDVRDVTVQDSIMGEGLFLSKHPEGIPPGGHGMAANVTQLERDLPFGRRITFVHNLFTTSNERMPRFQGPQCVDVVNNVIYDWGTRAAYGNPRSLNLVANVFRAGPDTIGRRLWVGQHSTVVPQLVPDAVFMASNVADGFQVGGPAGDRSVFREDPACPLSVQPADARSILEPLLDTVGASLPVRDAVDRRIVTNVIERRGGFRNGAGQGGLHPDWPTLGGGPPEGDDDLDGLPDDWERQQFGSLDHGSPDDSSSDADGDGWTDLEEYLNGTDPGAPDRVATPGG